MVIESQHKSEGSKESRAKSEYFGNLPDADHVEPASDDESVMCMVEGCQEPAEELIALMSDYQESDGDSDEISPAAVCKTHYEKLLATQFRKSSSAPTLAES